MAKRPKQPDIPGTETVRKDPKLHRLAIDFAEKRDARMRLQDPEKDAKAALMAYMKEKGYTTGYKFGAVEIVYDPGKPNVTVKVDKGAEE